MSLRKLLKSIRWRQQPIRWWWQRRTRGFDDRDLWSLDYAIIKFIHPRLKFFRNGNYGGTPGHLTEVDEDGMRRALTDQEWEGILDEMLEGFQLVIDQDCYPLHGDDHKKLEHSLDVFRKNLSRG